MKRGVAQHLDVKVLFMGCHNLPECNLAAWCNNSVNFLQLTTQAALLWMYCDFLGVGTIPRWLSVMLLHTIHLVCVLMDCK